VDPPALTLLSIRDVSSLQKETQRQSGLRLKVFSIGVLREAAPLDFSQVAPLVGTITWNRKVFLRRPQVETDYGQKTT
jgi:hypothetical protein